MNTANKLLYQYMTNNEYGVIGIQFEKRNVQQIVKTPFRKVIFLVNPQNPQKSLHFLLHLKNFIQHPSTR